MVKLLWDSRYEEQHRKPKWMAIPADTDVRVEAIEYSGGFSITCPVNWKSLFICLFVSAKLYYSHENDYKGYYVPLKRQGLDKYSHRNRRLIKHK